MPRPSKCCNFFNFLCPPTFGAEQFEELTRHLGENSPDTGLDFLRQQKKESISTYAHPKTGQTALHVAVFYANRYAVKDEKGLKCSSQGFKDLINYLVLTVKMDPNSFDSHNITPLMFAGRFLLIDTFTSMLHNGGNVSATSSKGHTIKEMMSEYKESDGRHKILDLLHQHNELTCPKKGPNK